MRRLQPRHPAALLVDQHRRVGAPDAAAQRADQRADLVGRLAIAREQDEAERIGGAEERAFARSAARRQQPKTTAMRLAAHRTRMHPTLRCFSSPQNRSAAASAIGPAWMR